ncbi:GEVED domain-containing protein [Flavobacterium sp.]|uniref:GEVED domain-containing protein n=1 Tax=Flavobacterium sp. TaxID=239 RepID=UPI0039E57D0B
MNNYYKFIRFSLPLFFLLLLGNTAFAQTVLTYNTASPGAGTWVCPAGVTSVQVETWGGGGGGGYAKNTNGYGGGGGGGGGYTSTSVSVVPGTTYYYTIAAGGAGGLAATNTAATPGGSSCFGTGAACTGILSSAGGGTQGSNAIVPASANGPGGAGGVGGTFNGGNGGNGVNATNATGGGGGGGGGASTTGLGGNGAGKTGGTGAAVGGGNGASGTQGSPGATGNDIGGGGSGGHRTAGNNQNGGAGAGGQVRLTYTLPGCSAPSQATAFVLGTPTSTTLPVSFSGTGSGYLVISSLANTPPSQPVNGTTYSAANIATLGAGFTFVQSGASTTIASSGLNGNTRYYYFIYAFNDASCSGGPAYNASGPLTGNGVTCPAVPNTVGTSAVTSSGFTVNWTAPTGGSAATITYTLQITSDAGYSLNVGASPYTLGAAAVSQAIAGLAPGTTYYYRILANNGCSSTYVLGSVTTTGGYCSSTTSTGTTRYINNFSTSGGISNVNNSTAFSTGGYGDYTVFSASQLAGQAINFSASYTGGTFGFGIWIDWNSDGDFLDASEAVFNSGAYNASNTGTFTVPAWATAGSKRMRVRADWLATSPAACGTITDGETEDYTFIVATPLPCNTFPTSFSTSNLTATTVTLNWGAPSPAPSNGYEYYLSTSPSSPTAGTTPTGSTAAGVTSVNVTGLTANTTYYWWVRSNCNGTDKGFWVGPASFYTAYCSSTSVNTGYYISNFTITGGITNFNNSTGLSAGGYGNHTGISASQQPYSSVNFSSTYSGGTFGFNIWIDWNDDLDFNDTGEKVYGSGSYNASNTGTFAVPGSATVGSHRMRIRADFNQTNPVVCGPINSGETEDYTFTVVAMACSGNPSNLPATGIGLTTATINWTAGSPAPASGYQYYYSTSASVPAYSTTPSGAVSAGVLTANLTGLASGTLYHVWVRANCGANQGVWVGPLTFTTNVAPPITTSASICQGAASSAVSGTASCTTFTNLGNTINGSWDATSDPRAVRPLIFISNSPICQFDTGGLTANYTALNFTVTVTGSYTFTMPNTTAYDAMGYIVIPPFTPGDCSSGTWIVGDDDSGATTFEPLMTATLTAGTSYVLYTTLYSGSDIALTNNYTWNVTGPGSISALASGALQWYTAPSGGTPIATGSNFNPVGIPGSGVTNTNTPGTTVFYAACSGSPGIRTATNYTITGPTSVLSGDGPVCSPTGTLMTVNFTGTAPWTFTYSDGVTPVTVTTSTNPYTFTVSPAAASTYTITALSDASCTAIAANRTGNGYVRSKTWNGSAGTDWNNTANWTPGGVPTSSDCVVIPNVTNDPIVNTGNAWAYNLTVLNGGVLNIASNYAITVTDVVNVNAGGTFELANASSLIQVNNVANTGIIRMTRNSQPMYRYDYTYWGSPVTQASNYTLGMLSPNTLADKYFSWIPYQGSSFGTWLHETSASVMDPRKGYIVRAPQTFSMDPGTKAIYPALFIGTPNNGTINCPILFGTMGAGTNNDKYNLLGNPYPSSVSAAAFLNLANNANVIDGTIYFWTHNSAISVVYPDPFYNDFVYNYTGSDYASWNKLGGVGTAASTGGPAPNGYIGAGQSFFVRSLTFPGGNAIFNNSMRSAAYSNTQFFRQAEGVNPQTANNEEDFEKHRLWLNFTTASTFSQILVGYAEGATYGWDRGYDGVRFDYENSNSLYSLVNGEPQVIQGRPLPFNEYDEVPLGYISLANNSEFTVRIDHYDGAFENQSIYIEDKLLNVIHDLRQSGYTFTTAQGRFDDRLVLRYTNATLSNNSFEVDGVSAFIHNRTLHVAATENIADITVYELNGKLVKTYQGSETKVFEDDFVFATGIYFAKIKLASGRIVNQKLMNK